MECRGSDGSVESEGRTNHSVNTTVNTSVNTSVKPWLSKPPPGAVDRFGKGAFSFLFSKRTPFHVENS
jgi:hypothetical protein